jgi:HEAT repeat protein
MHAQLTRLLGLAVLLGALAVAPTQAKRGDARAAPPTAPEHDPARAEIHRLANDHSIEALEAIAQHSVEREDARTKRAAHDALRRIALSTDQWLSVLQTSPQPQARATAADVLGHHPSRVVTTALQRAIQDPHAAVRAEVYEALARSKDRTVIRSLIRAAAKETDTAAALTAKRAAEYLAGITSDPTDGDAALADLQSDSTAAQQAALPTVARNQDWRATGTLLAWADDTDPTRRYAAIVALGELGNPVAVSDLARLLPGTPKTRTVLFTALAKLGDESAVDPLVRFLQAENAETRRLTVRTLGKIRPSDLTDLLRTAMTDREIAVRNEVLLALKPLPCPQKRTILLTALDDSAGPHRAAALRQLALDDADEVGAAVLNRLDDRDTLVRITAAETLARLGYTHGLDALKKRSRKAKDDDERAYYDAAIARLATQPKPIDGGPD